MAGLLLSRVHMGARECVSSLASSLWHVWGCSFGAPFPWGPWLCPTAFPVSFPGEAETWGRSLLQPQHLTLMLPDSVGISERLAGCRRAEVGFPGSCSPASLHPCPVLPHASPLHQQPRRFVFYNSLGVGSFTCPGDPFDGCFKVLSASKPYESTSCREICREQLSPSQGSGPDLGGMLPHGCCGMERAVSRACAGRGPHQSSTGALGSRG